MENVIKAETIFLCVPIRTIKKVVQQIGEKLNPRATVVDVCSVKLYPKEIMEKYQLKMEFPPMIKLSKREFLK